VSRIHPLTKIDKVRRDKPYKIESVPINKPVVEESVWGRPWHYVVIVAVLVGICLIGGWIGG